MARNMARNLDDIINGLPKKRRNKIQAGSARLVEEYETLRKLREALNYTQVEVAKALGMKQANVSQLEQRSDMLLSTLKKCLAAFGGKLELVATFPDRDPVILTGLSDVVPKHAHVQTRKASVRSTRQNPTRGAQLRKARASRRTRVGELRPIN
jgi:transcriptional regulator with XRE-family HTH domain